MDAHVETQPPTRHGPIPTGGIDRNLPEDGDTQEVLIQAPPSTTFGSVAFVLCALLLVAGLMLQG